MYVLSRTSTRTKISSTDCIVASLSIIYSINITVDCIKSPSELRSETNIFHSKFQGDYEL